MSVKEIFVKSSDGYPISVKIFQSHNIHHKLLLVNSATGVRQQIYFSFSKLLSESGFTVITYDYRGIGASKPKKMKGFKSDMKIWGTQDFKAVTDYIQRHYSDFEKYCLGHSVGALILGMNKDSVIFKKFIFVATQKAYVKYLNFRTKVEAYIGFGIMQPIITKILGYFPAHYFGLGESLPKGNAYDWRTLVFNKKSTNKLLEQLDNFSHHLHQDVLVIWAEDDLWLTEKGVKLLLEETYPNMKPQYRWVKVSESKKRKIGHINFFRSYNSELWQMIEKYLI